MTTQRCAVPFHPDPGQPAHPTGSKHYLVTGSNVVKPGAYSSWTSADAQYKGVSGATMKGYKSWTALESAWWAGCDRGEHKHPRNPLLSVTPGHAALIATAVITILAAF
ncbi:hypothetical protein C8F04DRAFT_1272607 [Mycena alexandri]|uniref:Ribonuclease H1 N-terminal domain-containing protein n=1 Tax=Mycena alexandri TaxID=1745969 RepID=A0AAD6WPR1_9AGAR|nr:hypothetical protein C8F04DRAFT_1272607 [Mycena alexandri]